MFKFIPGKKMHKLSLVRRNLLAIPYVIGVDVELRSYDDFSNPETNIGICVHLATIISYDRSRHLQSNKYLTLYYNESDGSFVDSWDCPYDIKYFTNWEDVLGIIKESLNAKSS